jgi:hypothetical protein
MTNREVPPLCLAFVLTLTSAPAASAHDLWLIPEEAPAVGKPSQVLANVGMAFPESVHAPDPGQFLRRLLVKPDGSAGDLQASDKKDKSGMLTFVPDKPGVYAIGVETQPKIIELSAAAFNAYLVADGLPHIYRLRAKEGTLNQPAQERYSKSPKALVRVGAGGVGDPCRPLGLTLEIVPLRDPFALEPGDALPVRVLFRGKPLPEANLGWQAPGDGDTARGTVRTDARGEALVPLAGAGLMTLRLTHMTRPRADGYEWESFWTTLTFHVQRRSAKKFLPAVAWHGRKYIPPRHYVCYRANAQLKIDGKLDDAAWQAVPWTEDFVDIEGDRKPRPRFRTRVKMLWDDAYFYIGAELEEPHVRATITQHDGVIFEDNDFEVFIDPDGDSHNYMEYEINALGTDWDLFLCKPYKDGGKADDRWEIPGLKKAVFVHGTLNDPRDTDRGWTVEIAFPWKALGEKGGVPFPPKDGTQWRVNFSRVEWQHEIVNGKYRKIKGLAEDNWVWSPQFVVNMHRPETWGYVQFSTASPGTVRFQPDSTGPARHVLHHVLYAQRAFQHQHGRWARSLEELRLEQLTDTSLTAPLRLEMQGEHFTVVATVRAGQGRSVTLRLRDDARLERK